MENIWCQGEFTSQFLYLIVSYHIGVEDVGFRLYIVFLLITESLLYNLFVGVTTVSSSGKIEFIVIINMLSVRTFKYISVIKLQPEAQKWLFLHMRSKMLPKIN